MGKRKLVLVINSLGAGGAERVASMLANELNRQRLCAVEILTLDSNGRAYSVAEDVLCVAFPGHRLFRGGAKLFALPIQALWVAYRVWRASFRNGEVEVLGFLHRANLVAIYACAFMRRRALISERSLFLNSYFGIKRRIMGGLLRGAYGKARGVIAISQAVKEELISSLFVDAAKIVVINNPASVVLQSPRTYVGRPIVELLYVGRLIESKKVGFLIEALEKLNCDRLKFRLTIVGDGPMRAVLEKKASTLEFRESVFFSGQEKHVTPYFLRADVFVFASEYESFGNVLIEAVSSGLPVVYADQKDGRVDIFPDASCGGTPYLPGDIDSFCEALMTITVASAWECQSKNAVNNGRRFEEQSIVNRYAHEIFK